jgi:F-type H+-transporting ATPase subunit epsilon
MRLLVTTPTSVVEEVSDVLHVRAEDETGAFGIEPGHADFVTVLPASVINWRDREQEGFVVVLGGVLTVEMGDLVQVAARDAYRENDLSQLGDAARKALERSLESEHHSRKSETLLHLATMRQINNVLQGAERPFASAPKLSPLTAREKEVAK